MGYSPRGTDAHPNPKPPAALPLALETWPELKPRASFAVSITPDQTHLHGNGDGAVDICLVQPALLYHPPLLGAEGRGILKESERAEKEEVR